MTAFGESNGEGKLQGGHETILLVEDEATVREVTRKLLQKLGYRVITARNAQEGIDIFRAEGAEVDAVVTDVIMPGLTGIQMAERLREIRPQLRVLFVSGYASRDVGEGPERPPEPFLPKPFSLLELAESVRTVLDD